MQSQRTADCSDKTRLAGTKDVGGAGPQAPRPPAESAQTLCFCPCAAVLIPTDSRVSALGARAVASPSATVIGALLLNLSKIANLSARVACAIDTLFETLIMHSVGVVWTRISLNFGMALPCSGSRYRIYFYLSNPFYTESQPLRH